MADVPPVVKRSVSVHISGHSDAGMSGFHDKLTQRYPTWNVIKTKELIDRDDIKRDIENQDLVSSVRVVIDALYIIAFDLLEHKYGVPVVIYTSSLGGFSGPGPIWSVHDHFDYKWYLTTDEDASGLGYLAQRVAQLDVGRHLDAGFGDAHSSSSAYKLCEEGVNRDRHAAQGYTVLRECEIFSQLDTLTFV